MIAKCSFAWSLALVLLLLLTRHAAQAQVNPVLLSAVPATGTTNVSPDTSVVFTFSKSMDTKVTTSLFLDPQNSSMPLPRVESWNGNTTVLTATFPLGLTLDTTILWRIRGADVNGNPFEEQLGSFQTSSGSQTNGLLLTSPVLNGSTITFDVLNTTPGQTITLEIRSTLQSASWVTKETKTATGNKVTFTDTVQTGKSFLYRARTGDGSPTGDLTLSSPVRTGSTLSIDVSGATSGQPITLETSSTLLPGSWVKQETKTATGNIVTFSDTIQPGKKFYRARTGT